MKTFYCDSCYWDLLDEEGEYPFAESVYLSIDEENTLRIHDGAGLNHWLFTLDPIPNDPLYSINIKSASYFFDFLRVTSAIGNHLLGRMQITSDRGAGSERLVFRFTIKEYNKIGKSIKAVVEKWKILLEGQ